MLKRLMSFVMAFGLSVWLLPGLAYSGDDDAIRRGLQEHLRPSHMEAANPALEGYVFKPGAVLVLQAERASAKKLRVIQANTKSPRFHVRDYAEVTVGPDGSIKAGLSFELVQATPPAASTSVGTGRATSRSTSVCRRRYTDVLARLL